MRLGFVVSEVAAERPVYTTITVALAALRRGHEVWFIDLADFAWDRDDRIRARARSTRPRPYGDDAGEQYLADLTGSAARRERIAVDELDVLWLRSEPSFDAAIRPEVQSMAFAFGRAAQERGVVVLSDPDGLARALADKLYSQRLPEPLRPSTLITCDADEIVAFADAHAGDVVVKPLQGGGGHAVFFVRKGIEPNLRQIVDAVRRFGYVVVQEYLPEARHGTVRLFLLDGRPLQLDGRYAVLRHMPLGGDERSNFRVSGTIAAAELDAAGLAVAEAVGPTLAADGMFLVGLDIVGDKLLEANLFSPGGLRGAERLQGVRFSDAVVAAMEERLAAARPLGGAA
jgi:glutathione synthase